MEQNETSQKQFAGKIYLGKLPERAEKKKIEIKTERIPENQKPGKYHICAVIKDEHDYIREWALHNRSLGFDQIVLYDNNSSKPYDEVLGDLIREGFIEIRLWPDNRWDRQVRAYNDFVWSGDWSRNDYCAFIDPDEFIFFDKAKTISEFLKLYSDYAGVSLSWRLYNANGRIETPKDIPTIEAYTTEFDFREPRTKPIGRLKNIVKFVSDHTFIPSRGELVTTGKQVIRGISADYKDFTNGHIKHYISKSWQDWVKRLKRGNMTKGLRTVDLFFVFNPDMEYLRETLTKNLNIKEFPTIKNNSNQGWRVL